MAFIKWAYAKGGESLWLVTVVSDMLVVIIARQIAVFAISLLLNRTMLFSSVYPSLFAPVAVGVLCMVFLVFLSMGLYSTRRFKSYTSEVRGIIGSVALVALTIMAIFFLLHLDDVSRLNLFVYFVILLILLIAERYAWRVIIQGCFKRGIGLHKLLLVGSNITAQRFYKEIIATDKAVRYGLDYMGYVALAPNEHIKGYLGGAKEYRDILAGGKVKDVLAASTWDKYEAMGDMVVSASRFNARFSVISVVDGLFDWRLNGERIGHFNVATLHLSPRTNPSWGFIKRAMDIVGSLLALILGSPFMLYAAIVIKKNSPDGPIIFRQKRCGLQGRTFTMYKFRTMVPNAEELKASLDIANEAEGPVFKMKDDPRIFKGAKFLRSSSIDELPQLVNVLKGSMSLVGPRPPLPDEVAKYEDWEWARLSVKPGLTCYWQVSGRSNVSFAEWMHLDLEYVRDQCFTTDMKILLKTFGAVFSGRGAC
jgi:exopolysaccharide biosynthesis polyprenyl glycosylphosphotransferase